MASVVDLLHVKIATLKIISQLPERPVANSTSHFIDTENSQSGRALSFKHELAVTQQLAFICAYSHDPLHVTAVCIEESIDSSSLTIRFAANTGQHHNLINGMTNISRILEGEANYGLLVLF
jgi:hypothetical protein